MNTENVGKLNGLVGGLAGQAVEYGFTKDFKLNLANLSMLSLTDSKGEKTSASMGLLELTLGGNGTSIKIGSGGANVSIDNVIGAIQGAMVWNVNDRIKKNDFDAKIALRAQYGYGDAVQKGQLWDILNGKAVINTDANGEYTAETVMENGKRVINLSGYDSNMSREDEMRLAVVLGHEAYRDGIVTADNNLETHTATLAHTAMLVRMLDDKQNVSAYEGVDKDLEAYFAYKASGDISKFNEYVDGNYDSSGDYWKRTADGGLEYDGFATYRDEDGNVLKTLRDMGLTSENSIESALLWLLGISSNDTDKVLAVRQMMGDAGLQHSYDADSNNWTWKGERDAIIENMESGPIVGKVDLTAANMGVTISLNMMADLYSSVGATGAGIKTSLDRIYSNPVNYLYYAATGGNLGIASDVLFNYYNLEQMVMLYENAVWLYDALENGVNINGMPQGDVARTSKFEQEYNMLKLSSSSVEGAEYFSEEHTGIDFGSGGTAINIPGGYWELSKIDDHRAYYQLYGSDLKMRIQHVEPDALKKIELNTIYGGSENKLLDYPTESYGSGTGAHIHIDMTRSLPYNGSYTRQFVNPETLSPGTRLNYQYSYMDVDKNYLPKYPMNFNRY